MGWFGQLSTSIKLSSALNDRIDLGEGVGGFPMVHVEVSILTCEHFVGNKWILGPKFWEMHEEDVWKNLVTHLSICGSLSPITSC